MDDVSFSEWRIGQPSTVVLARPFVVSYNFTFTPVVGGTYFFVFDNQDTSRRVIIFSLNAVQTQTVLHPIAAYGGYEMLVIGILLAALGAKIGRKKRPAEQPEAPSTTSWNCKFCRAENSSNQAFCVKCGRSQQ